MVVLVLFLLLFALLAFDGQELILQGDLDVLLLDARDLGS
jgi:hypothetical protein